ncbi:hypothetical protein X742_03825 [Mesorhizobium sp. LNHC232B00]|nr:hypothetical protein X742_03825 [Mesorhizobium sp. LNHC232B00]
MALAAGAHGGQSISERAESQCRERAATKIEAALLRRCIGRDLDEQQIDRDQAERQVDGEDRPPDAVAESRKHQTAEHGTKRGGQGRGRCPDADRSAALLFRVGLGDDGEAAGHHDRGTNALEGAKRDQHDSVRRQRTGERGGDEKRNAGHEGAAQPEPIAGGTAGKDQRRQRQRIGIGNPLRLGEAGAEIDADRRHGDGQDRAVDEAERRSKDRCDQHVSPLRLRTEGSGGDRAGQRDGGCFAW